MSKLEEKSSQMTSEEVFAEIGETVERGDITLERVLLLVRREVENTLELRRNSEHLPEKIPELEELICALSKEAVRARKAMLCSLQRVVDLRYALSSRMTRISGLVIEHNLWNLEHGKKSKFAYEVSRIREELKVKNEDIPTREYPDIETLDPSLLEERLKKEGKFEEVQGSRTKSQFVNQDRKYPAAEYCEVMSMQLDELKMEVTSLRRNIKLVAESKTSYEEKLKGLQRLIAEVVEEIKNKLESCKKGKFKDMKGTIEEYAASILSKLDAEFPQKQS